VDDTTSGNIRLEVIAEDTLFIPWESDFEIAASKKVTVEVKTQSKPILETKVKVNVKEEITLTERDHVVNLFKLLINEDINISNIAIKRNKLNNIVGTYLKGKEINDPNKIIGGVIKALSKKK
tara:strand:- start:1146 stop:1514 length:369 start_codon:yes stop_codon:yes gene_type:complete